MKRAMLLLAPIAVLASAPAMAQSSDPNARSPELTMLNDVCAPWPNGPQPRPHFSFFTTTGNSTIAHTGLFPDTDNVDPSPVPGYNMNPPGNSMTGGNNTNPNEGGHLFPPGDSFGDDPKNLLPTVYENIRSCMGNEIINTVPSTPENPYNLQFAGDPDNQRPNVADTTPLSENLTRSPTDDLDVVRRHLLAARNKNDVNPAIVQRGIDILEGNQVADRSYSGFPVLHYNGPLKIKSVDPVTRTVEINQIWFDTHIESDTMYIDTCAVEKIGGVLNHETGKCDGGDWDDGEWFVKYNIFVLNRGHEDFASFPMLYDDPKEIVLGGQNQFIPNVSLDQTFFPMEEGFKYTFFIKQPPARFFNLTYHWGWRLHPPRVQAVENLLRGFTVDKLDANGQVVRDANGNPVKVDVFRDHFERTVFGENPRANEDAKLQAISMIGDLAPAKRMWTSLKKFKANSVQGNRVRAEAEEFSESFFDWSDRNELPRGISPDPDADVTIAYLNNTIYGHIKGYVNDAQVELTKWTERGTKVNVALINGDYYPHQYTLVDFGGMRGWENTFQNTIEVGGAGAWFTFGRIHWWPHTINPAVPAIVVKPAERPAADSSLVAHGMGAYRRIDRGDGGMLPLPGRKHQRSNIIGNDLPNELVGDNSSSDGLGRHNIEWEFTYEPGRRLRMYQFDAFHHDVAVWSIH
ncbi:MAG TPA: hypothetical protein DEA40_15115 [Parvularcula sp.]|nr:hypothetical protein [Parvularcula sp.]